MYPSIGKLENFKARNRKKFYFSGFCITGYFKEFNNKLIMNLEEIKEKLRSYKEADIKFYEPHFTENMIGRGGSRKDVIENLLNPMKLVHVKLEIGIYGDMKHVLFFELGRVQTLKLPVIFNESNKKTLYIITYIMRYRPWQEMIN